MAKTRQKMKKNDIAIYTICGTARQVKILSGSVDLAYNAGRGFKILLPDGGKIYASEKNLQKIEPENENGMLRGIKSTFKLTGERRTPDEAYNPMTRTKHELRTEAGQAYIIPLCKNCKTPACYICGFCKNLNCKNHFCIDKNEAKS
jgi:hypothetical protein